MRVAVMAVMNKTFVSPKQARAAEQAVGFEAEQRRLKAEAAVRRAAAAAAGETVATGFSPRPDGQPGVARGSRYLR